jgi:hypothetical protein
MEVVDTRRPLRKRLDALPTYGASFTFSQLPTGALPASVIPSHLFSVVYSQRLGLPLPYAHQQLVKRASVAMLRTAGEVPMRSPFLVFGWM